MKKLEQLSKIDKPGEVGERMKKKLCGELKDKIKKHTVCEDCKERLN